MLVWCTVALLLAIIAARLWTGRWLGPATIIALVWLGAMWANRLPFLNLYEPSGETYVLYAGSGLAFMVGFLVLGAGGQFRPPRRESLAGLLISPKGLIITQIAAVIVLYVLAQAAYASFSLLRSGSTDPSLLRAEYYASGGRSVFGQVGGLLAGRFGGLIATYFLRPGAYCLFMLSLVRALASASWPSRLLLVGGLSGMVALDAIALGRYHLSIAILSLACSLILGKELLGARQPAEARRVWREYWMFVAALLVAAFLVLVAFTLVRMRGRPGAGLVEALRLIIFYYGAPLSAFDQREAFLVDDNFIYSLGGFCDWFNDFWRLILRHREDLFLRTLDLQPYFDIGLEVRYNALFSWCLQFYQDLGAVGVFLGPALYGLLTGAFYRAYRTRRDPGFFVGFLLLYVMGLWGVLDWRLHELANATVLVGVLALAVPVQRRIQTAARVSSERADGPMRRKLPGSGEEPHPGLWADGRYGQNARLPGPEAP